MEQRIERQSSIHIQEPAMHGTAVAENPQEHEDLPKMATRHPVLD